MSTSPMFANKLALAAQLRAKADVSPGYASDLANGRRLPSLTLAAKIEAELGIRAAEWIDHQQACEAERSSDSEAAA